MLTVGEICSRSPRVTTPEATLAQAAKAMWDGDCGILPVVDSARKVVGLLTDRDIAMALALRGDKAHDAVVKDAMSSRVISCKSDEPAGAALARLGKFQLRRMPVVNADGVLEGVFSLADAIRNSGRWMGEKGSDLAGDKLIGVLQLISESPDAKKTLQIPGKR